MMQHDSQAKAKIEMSALTLFHRQDKEAHPRGKKSKHLELPSEHQTQQHFLPQTNLLHHGQSSKHPSRSSSNFHVNTAPGLKQRNHSENPHQYLELSAHDQNTQDTLLLLADSRIDIGSVDESMIKDEKTKNLIHAIKVRKERAEHSDFYYLLDKVNDQIYMYKSLFMDKLPRYMRNYSNIRISTNEIKEQKIKAQEEEKRQKQLLHQRVKQKKNQFYDNLSKKMAKNKLVTTQRRGILLDTQNIQQMAASQSLTCMSPQDLFTHPYPSPASDFDYIHASILKEQARKERLYAQKSKTLLPQRSTSLNSLSQKEVIAQPTLEVNTTIKNDITYLHQLRASASLPYLKHIQVQTNEHPLQHYLQQRSKEIEDKHLSIDEGKKKRKILMLAERKFQRLNQKCIIHTGKDVVTNNNHLTMSGFHTQRVVQQQVQQDTSGVIYQRISTLPVLDLKLSQSMKSTQLKDILLKNQTQRGVIDNQKITHLLKDFHKRKGSAQKVNNENMLLIECSDEQSKAVL